MYKIIINNKNNEQIIIKTNYASSYVKRMKGLMFQENITPLLFKQKNSNKYLSAIHTMFMKKTIDILYINTEDKIEEMITLQPWKIHIPNKSNTKYIIELPENTIKKNNITLNNKIKVVKIMKLLKNNDEHVNNSMIARSTIQTAMNTTRDKLNRGTFKENEYELVPLTIQDKRIPSEFDGYRIVHLTDLHLGQWINQKKLDGIVKLTNKQHPDLIVMTGDYMSYQADKYIPQLEESLKNLKPKDATLSVLGNHDHWTNPEKIKEALKKDNIINLENEVYIITRNNKKLQIAGADSVTVGKDDIKKIEKQLDKNAPAIMLVHEPDFADTTAQLDQFILQLSGHSHGGQISIPKIGTPVRGKNFIKYPKGKYKVKNMIQYTSSGVGTNTFWLRINCPPEITKITLRTKE